MILLRARYKYNHERANLIVERGGGREGKCVQHDNFISIFRAEKEAYLNKNTRQNKCMNFFNLTARPLLYFQSFSILKIFSFFSPKIYLCVLYDISERSVQGAGGETRGEETTGETQA